MLKNVDPDEDMRQLSKQSHQVDSIMSSKRRKERRQKKVSFILGIIQIQYI